MSGGNGVVLVVKGLRGFLGGEEQRVKVGEALIVGRSREAGLSTRRAKKLKARPDWEKVIGTAAFLTVSRRHTRIEHVKPGVVEITDLSSNGTYLDGKLIARETISDLAEKAHILGIGAQERFELSLAPAEEAASPPGEVAADPEAG
jgi:pSer/pThr/pTyr-binding forkhead associated (FHA) protein